jgi:hypothetical protein
VYLTKPDDAAAGMPETKADAPRGVPGRRGPTTRNHGAAA